METVNGISVTCKCGAKLVIRNDDLVSATGELYDDSTDKFTKDGMGRLLAIERIYDRFMRYHKDCLSKETNNGIVWQPGLMPCNTVGG